MGIFDSNFEYSDFILKELTEKAYTELEIPIQLNSGQWIYDYVQCQNILSNPALLETVAILFFQKMETIDSIGALSVGALPLAIALSMYTQITSYTKPWFFVYKDMQIMRIKGGFQKHQNVLIIDDVITTGNSIIDCIDTCEKAGMDVKQVLTLVSRNAEAIKNIKNYKNSILVESLFSLEQIKNYTHKNKRGMT